MIPNQFRHRERMKQSSFIVASKCKSIVGQGSKKEIGGLRLTEVNHKSNAPIPQKSK